MYGFPTDFDCREFIGKRLEMVCFNSTQIYLHFSDGLFVTINGEFSHELNENKKRYKLPVFYPNFINLCEEVVVEAFVEEEKNLYLKFESQHVVCLYDDPKFEAYEINKNGKRMIV